MRTSIHREHVGCIAETGPYLLFLDFIRRGVKTESELLNSVATLIFCPEVFLQTKPHMTVLSVICLTTHGLMFSCLVLFVPLYN